MQINNLLYNYIKQDIPKELLMENEIFKGEIIEILDNAILIDIPDKGIVRAESEIDLSKYLGENINFLIESKSDKRIEIKPIIEEIIENADIKKEASILRVLEEFNIEENQLSKDLIKSFMKHKLPLKEDIINDGIKTLDKLVQLIELEDEDNIELIFKDSELETPVNKEDSEEFANKEIIENKTMDIKNKSSDELTIDSKDLGESFNDTEDGLDILKNILKEMPDMEKELKLDIKNMIITKGDIGETGEINDLVKNFLSEFNLESTDELVDMVTYMIKNDIETNLNNIKNIKELVDDPFKFFSDIKSIRDNLIDEDFIKNELMDELPIELEEKINKNVKIKKEHIEEIIKDKIETKSEIKDSLLEIRNKTEFIKDMNSDMYYHMIPINYGEKELDGFINIMKDKRSKKNNEDKLNVFINLDTNNLGNVKVSCQVDGEYLNLRIGMNKEDQHLFELGKTILIDRIEKYGYKVKNLIFLEEEKINILDDMVEKNDPMHFLDIKV